MSFSLLPKIIIRELCDLTPDVLHKLGIQLLMLDFDNTIVPYTTNIPTKRMSKWLTEMKRSDIQLCVVSNSKRERVPAFCTAQGLDFITHANKPFPKGIKECLARYHHSPTKAALVGDQIYTDVLGANCAGIHSILVQPINNHNFWLKARHVLELPIISLAKDRILHTV